MKHAPLGPYRDELLHYLFEKLKRDNPLALEPQFCKLVRESGGFVIYTVPHNPDDMPFEFCNAYIKYHCKKTVKRNRSMDELFKNIQEGFYGGISNAGREHRPIDKKMIEGWFNKCHENMNKEIKNILKMENISISDLWNQQSPYKVGDPYIKCPWTQQTIKKFQDQFEIVLN